MNIYTNIYYTRLPVMYYPPWLGSFVGDIKFNRIPLTNMYLHTPHVILFNPVSIRRRAKVQQ